MPRSLAGIAGGTRVQLNILTTDPWPTDTLETGSTLTKLDPATGKVSSFWYYDLVNVNPINSTHWWQIGG